MLVPFAFSVLQTSAILAGIRSHFDEPSINIKAYIVPYSGVHYLIVADCDRRITAISNFTGSSASVILTKTEALLWTDGRYYLQAELQLDENWTLMKQDEIGVPKEAEWLISKLSSGGGSVGVDAALYSKTAWDKMFAALGAKGIELKDINKNLIDAEWTDRPNCSANSINEFPIEFSGKSVKQKLIEVRQKMDAAGVDLLLVSEFDETAWLFNLRGSDYPPGFFAFAIISLDNAELLIKEGTMSESTIKKLLDENVSVKTDYNIAEKVFQEKALTANRVWISKYVNARMASLVTPEKQHIKLSPIALLKSIKNPTEIDGMKQALLRDSAAIVTYFSWLETQIIQEKVTNITEISGAAVLFNIRDKHEYILGESFPAVSAFGSNAAVIHYRATEDTNKLISTNGLYLLDSGGQYRDGTTDITRTVHLGNPTAEQKDRFTRVLKGHIALASAIFPNKVTGHRLDTLARKYLWEVHLDYKHGTGHGIGHHLYVHEGPQRISSGVTEDDSGLEENMFISNEPGYYKDNEYGIRIENIVRVAKSDNAKGNNDFLSFETLSFVPIQLKLIDETLLTTEEVSWLDKYHEQCREKVGNYIRSVDYIENKDKVLEWLDRSSQSWKDFRSSSSSAELTLLSSAILCCSLLLQPLLHRLL